jgi:hypothetical protein
MPRPEIFAEKLGPCSPDPDEAELLDRALKVKALRERVLRDQRHALVGAAALSSLKCEA